MTNDKQKMSWLHGVIAVVALIGLADATYLTVEHISGRTLQCNPEWNCSTVLSSEYSKLFGYPLSGFGAVAYFTVFSMAVLIAFDYKILKPVLLVIVSLMALMSCWLIYLQAFVIKAFCPYCLLSAIVCFTLFALTLAARLIERKQSVQ
jgi:uncharacterized membrane protein